MRPTNPHMAHDLTIFDEPHHQSLELLAIQALSRRDYARALLLADRRCRIRPLADAHVFVLRGEASFRLGAEQDAVSDITKALDIDPDDTAANRRMLEWGQPPRQTDAARALVGRDHDVRILHKCLTVLAQNKEEACCQVVVEDERVRGWAAWDRTAKLDVRILSEHGIIRITCEADPAHPLRNPHYSVADFSLRRPRSHTPQTIMLSAGGTTVWSMRVAGNAGRPLAAAVPETRSSTVSPGVSVILPIFVGDYAATKACLESLLPELSATDGHRAILIDDASPDPRTRELLEPLSKNPLIRIVENKVNLGFVGAVNQGLSHSGRDDVVLLNSDTIVRPGTLSRLKALAAAHPDVGTITPLSNNGEFTSFPRPNRENPLPSADQIGRIDDIAAEVNRGLIVDLPNGIGFCLYVTRACLNATGPLSENFRRGYLEDVDLCLRARQIGLRSVCAPSVFVAHAGSRSFGQDKRSLVVHNLRILEQRFPTYRQECAAFLAADPLSVHRKAIELRLPRPPVRPHLLIVGSGIIGVVARERARVLSSQGLFPWLLEVETGGRSVRVFDFGRGVPQSLNFALSDAHGREALTRYLEAVQPSRIECLDPASTPAELIDISFATGAPIDIFVADAGLVCPPGALIRYDYGDRSHGWRVTTTRRAETKSNDAWRPYWEDVARRANRVLVPDREAEAFVRAVLPELVPTALSPSSLPQPKPARRKTKQAAHLGIIPLRSCMKEWLLMRDVIRSLIALRPDIRITVAGRTSNDIELMRMGDTFVTGPVELDEYDRLLRLNGMNNVFVCTHQPLFGHPVFSRIVAVNTAFFDWSNGDNPARKGDLALSPSATPSDVAQELYQWIGG